MTTEICEYCGEDLSDDPDYHYSAYCNKFKLQNQSQAGVNMHDSNSEQVEMVKHSPDTQKGYESLSGKILEMIFRNSYVENDIAVIPVDIAEEIIKSEMGRRLK